MIDEYIYMCKLNNETLYHSINLSQLPLIRKKSFKFTNVIKSQLKEQNENNDIIELKVIIDEDNNKVNYELLSDKYGCKGKIFTNLSDIRKFHYKKEKRVISKTKSYHLNERYNEFYYNLIDFTKKPQEIKHIFVSKLIENEINLRKLTN